MSKCVINKIQQSGKTWTLEASLQTLLKGQVGIQTVKTLQLISEYSHVVHSDVQCKHDDHKLIAAPISTGKDSAEQQTKRPRTSFKYGILRKPEQFLSEALSLVRPIDGASVLHQNTKDAIDFVVGNDPTQVAKARMNFCYVSNGGKNWLKRRRSSRDH